VRRGSGEGDAAPEVKEEKINEGKKLEKKK
jgi:hypothetical protein